MTHRPERTNGTVGEDENEEVNYVLSGLEYRSALLQMGGFIISKAVVSKSGYFYPRNRARSMVHFPD